MKRNNFFKQGFTLALMGGSIFLTACGGSNEEVHGLQEIRIAQTIDESNPNSGVVFEAFRESLEDYLEIPVVGIQGASHLVGIEAMRAGNLEIMWGAPFVYLLAKEATDVERLVVTHNDEAINKTVFITRSDREDIQNLEDLEGKTFAFITPSSTSGFLYPMYHLMDVLDHEKNTLLHSGPFFNHVAFSGSQDASIMGVIREDFDAASVGFLNLQSMIASGLIDEEDIRIIAYTERIPFPGYIARADLPDDLNQRIQSFMLSFNEEDYFEERFGNPNTRFVLPEKERILHLMSMVETLGIDIEAQQ